MKKKARKRKAGINVVGLMVKAASKTKALDVVVLDLSDISSFTDYFVICSGRSDRQVRAIADSIIDTLEKKGARPLGVEGYNEGRWILIDFGSVVAHVFYPPVREFYNLEGLWGDARRVML